MSDTTTQDPQQVSTDPDFAAIAKLVDSVSTALINLKKASLLTQSNVDEANKVLGIFLGKVETKLNSPD